MSLKHRRDDENDDKNLLADELYADVKEMMKDVTSMEYISVVHSTESDFAATGVSQHLKSRC